MESKLQKIAERAYHKFVMRGGEHGHDLADWVEAEKEIEAEEKAKRKIHLVQPKIKKSRSAMVSHKKPGKR